MVALTALAHAVPASRVEQQELWEGFFRGHYSDHPVAARVWRGSGIASRHGVVDPRVEDVSQWGTAARMRRYLEEALPLGKEAVGASLARAGLAPADIGLFAVATCTGYATPGLDILLARDLGMPASVLRLQVGHMGCYAAIPGLGAVSDFAAARGKAAVLLCLELPTLHVQPAVPDVQQMIAHSLFGDAAAAAVVQPGAPGLEVLDVVARTDVTTADHMTWDVTELGFRMGLSPRVPDVLRRHAEPVVTELLARHGLVVGDVEGWAVHPGGRRIVEVIGESLGLTASALQPSYDVLRDFGNCSSPTVLLVLERLALRPGAYAVAMAFGPGLTLYAALLRRSDDPAPR